MFSRLTTPLRRAPHFSNKNGILVNTSKEKYRFFSSATSVNGSPLSGSANKPPSSLTEEMAFGVQDATRLYLRHGLGMQRLQELSKESGDTGTLVERWQKMMEAFLGTQVHVLAGLGYATDETGLGEHRAIEHILPPSFYMLQFFHLMTVQV